MVNNNRGVCKGVCRVRVSVVVSDVGVSVGCPGVSSHGKF